MHLYIATSTGTFFAKHTHMSDGSAYAIFYLLNQLPTNRTVSKEDILNFAH